MSEIRFPLPDVGEGLTEAEIVQWRVAPGDRVVLDQVFVEIETAKSLVELPSAHEGVVAELLVAEGQTIDVGTAIMVLHSDAGTDGADESASNMPESASDKGAGEAEQIVADTAATIAHEGSGAVLVGHGSSGPSRSRRARHPMPGGAHERLAAQPSGGQASGAPAAEHGSAGGAGDPERRAAASARADESVPVLAKPPIRKLAKDLGVDLAHVTPTGRIGEVTRDDVVREASQASVFRNIETPDWPRGREEKIPVKGVRKAIASAMVQSAFSAPHVGLFVDVDATRTMEYVKRLKASTDFAGVKVSPLLVIAKAMIWAVRRNPTVNAQWADDEITVKHYVNLGIAAATPRGLIVPNVKDAQNMTMVELAAALEQLTLTAREGKTPPAEMQNGTITITNIGVFGMDTGTPILNPGEVGIVALGTIKQRPWVVDGEVRPRYVTTLGASFDHRVVDGDVASRFLADVASIIEEPALLLE